jgi:hypothetical protein
MAAIVAIVTWLLAACAAGATPTAPTAPTSSPLTSPAASSSPAPTGGNAGVPGCPNFVEVVETGPMPGDERTRDERVAREAQRISADAEAAQQYGAEHPDEFAGLHYENGPWVRLVIGFTAHLAEHCAALRELLALPEEFELIRLERTEADRLEIQEQIVDFAQPFLVSAGSGGARDVIEVVLRADGDEVAGQLVAQYGDLVDVTVGLLSFPERSRPDGVTTCSPASGSQRADSPLRASLVLTSGAISSGADFRGKVTVVNSGAGKFDFESGSPSTALVYRPAGSEAIGAFSGLIGGVGVGETLGPLDAIDIDVLGGTASCDPALGYALPPGSYEVRAVVDVLTMHDDGPTDTEYILSDPAPLTIVP